MSNIRILPDILSNKIAAGEVVERPASVVKELAENALDAGATRILIDIEQGGRSLIRVADNGGGMNRDDALLAIERHATSKIASDEDLFNIRTLGFRGEALPSIAAVSRFALVTRDAASDAGTELTIEGGKLVNVAETGAPAGTLVTVRQLFFNTPARRKFLKSVATEMAHIADILAGMALAWPQVQFRLTHNERVVKNWPAAADPFERAVEVLGGGLRDDLHAARPVARGAFGQRLGFEPPRPPHLVERHFHPGQPALGARPGGAARPFPGLFPAPGEGPVSPGGAVPRRAPDQVDVNVHPAKNEVRFARSNDVHELIRRAVAQTLYDVDRPGFRQKTPETNQVRDGKESYGGGRVAAGMFGPGDRDEAAYGNRGWKAAPTSKEELPHGSPSFVGEASSLDDRGGTRPSKEDGYLRPSALPTFQTLSPPATRLQTEIWEKRGFAGMRVIGQLRRHLHSVRGRGRADPDRPACRPRAGALRPADPPGRVPADRPRRRSWSLKPWISASGRPRPWRRSCLSCGELGLEVEPFGGGTVVVKAVPGFLSGREVRPLLTEIAEAAAGSESPANPQEALDFCRQRAACHGAIRAGQSLTSEQMQDLLRQLDECGNLSHCPHGRPTWLKWEMGVIERSFKRT